MGPVHGSSILPLGVPNEFVAMMSFSSVRPYARIALLAVVFAFMAPAGDADEDESTSGDDVILQCISDGKSAEECTDWVPYYDPIFFSNDARKPVWANASLFASASLFSLPALTGPSTAELFRQNRNRKPDHRYEAHLSAETSR